MDNSVIAFLNRIRRTDLSTGRFIAVPANICGRRDAFATLDEVEIDHRLSAMGFALFARLQTGAASDTAGGIDIKLVPEH
jgi:hypothetical protein